MSLHRPAVGIPLGTPAFDAICCAVLQGAHTMASYTAKIADIIAREIIHTKSRKKWPTLNDEAQRELLNMANEKSSTVTTSMNVAETPASRIPLGRDVMDRVNPSGPAIRGGSTLPRENAGSNTTGLMGVGSQVNVGPIKPVDRKTITGSTPGDFRKSGDYAKASVDEIANAGGPRDAAKQFQNSKFDKGAPFISTPVNLTDSDAGN